MAAFTRTTTDGLRIGAPGMHGRGLGRKKEGGPGENVLCCCKLQRVAFLEIRDERERDMRMSHHLVRTVDNRYN